MFIKPYRIKSQTQLKGSEKKKFRADVFAFYPALTEADISEILPNKADIILSKAFCAKGETVFIYQVQKDPLFFKFEKEKDLFPTVYFLWKLPTLLKTFSTHSNVVSKLAQGADLMLPGIVLSGEVTISSYGKFDKGKMVAVNTVDNISPVAIGRTAHSSMDMYMAARQGKGVNILHVYGDYLWQMGSKSSCPEIGITPVKTDSFGSQTENSAEPEITNQLQSIQISPDEEGAESTPIASNEPQMDEKESMDHLLVHCFIKALKTSAKKVELPILTSNFYGLHMIPACPNNMSIEVKKSSYKKISKFLGEMAKRGIIAIQEFPKGVESITDVNYSHEDVVNFIVDLEETTPINVNSNENAFVPPTLEDVYQVSGSTVQFYRSKGFSKGDVLTKSEIRKVVTDYIKEKNLQRSTLVELDSVLHGAIVGPKEGYKETLRWDEIFSRLLGKMSPAFKISHAGRPPIIRKGKLEPIEIATAKRSGNKKVTLIYNVGVFGIDENEFAHQIQIGVAASTSVSQAEHRPQGTIQVLVQGNQVKFVGKLLIETYNIPRKYIKGLELAVKGKK